MHNHAFLNTGVKSYSRGFSCAAGPLDASGPSPVASGPSLSMCATSSAVNTLTRTPRKIQPVAAAVSEA